MAQHARRTLYQILIITALVTFFSHQPRLGLSTRSGHSFG